MEYKLELLSPNLVQIIERCLGSQDLIKLLYYTTNDPTSSADIDPNIVAPSGSEERILPYPFDISFKDEQRSQLHVYYPDVQFVNNNHVERATVWFDIVVHKKLWLYSDNNKKLIRPYEIASEVARLFDGSIPNTNSTVGKLDFLAVAHVVVNEEFNALRLEAKMTTF